MNPAVMRFMHERGWKVAAEIDLPGREPRYSKLNAASVSRHTLRFVEAQFPKGLYLHQADAIEKFSQGNNVCLATGTASGKTLLFHAAAVECLARNNKSKILCLYPLRALASEQVERWKSSLRFAIKDINDQTVSRIDGSVPVRSRNPILQASHVVGMTPDVMHAWLLPNCGEDAVRRFLSSLSLVIIDEAHSYSGVFGSNSAFLFRRLRHICQLLGATPQFIAASATIASPQDHLYRLVGEPFEVIGEDQNGSGKHESRITLLYPPASGDLLTVVPALLGELARHEDHRFIAFMDSRKQVELISSITSREQLDDEPEDESTSEHAGEADSADDDLPKLDMIESNLDYLQKLSVLPYRSGYEEHDRKLIQKRLTTGSLRGVVSTSALELGIDIPSLDIAVLLGVPASSTSLYQRIGRVGRHRSSDVLIVHSGSILDEAVFAEPELLLSRPPAEGALYLENPRIQYIHALCLARLGGEHDSAAKKGGEPETTFSSPVTWPPGFIEMAVQERTGQVPVDLQSMKAEAGEAPHHAFPLRDVEAQFKVVMKRGPEEIPYGSISYSQCLREAYPGAVYRYATRPFRVYKVGIRSREVRIRPEKSYITQPMVLPTLVFPNLAVGNVFRVALNGPFIAAESNLQVREWVGGFTERRGSTERNITYPHNSSGGSFTYPHSAFVRNYFTTGVVLIHPSLDCDGVNREKLHELLYEALLTIVPFERTDLRSAADKLRVQWRGKAVGCRFLSIYDSTYGSLRLSGRLMEPDVLGQALRVLVDLAAQQELDAPTQAAAGALASAVADGVSFEAVAEDTDPVGAGEQIRVILEGSKGILLLENNQEFTVEKIYWNPKENGVWYRGRPEWLTNPENQMIVPVSHVAEIPGVSEMGYYNPDSGEVRPD